MLGIIIILLILQSNTYKNNGTDQCSATDQLKSQFAELQTNLQSQIITLQKSLQELEEAHDRTGENKQIIYAN